MKSPNNQLGYRIKSAREERKMTQEKLAEIIGISTVYLAEIENKRTIPSFPVLSSLCTVLNLSIDDLIHNTESTNAQKIWRLLTQCNEKQLAVILAMVQAMIDTDSEP